MALPALFASPIFQGALASLLPSLLGGFGLFGKDPQAELRKKIAQISNPQNLQKQTQQFYQQAIGSPAYSAAQGSIAAGANQAQNVARQQMGARGLGTSGVGAIAPALASSLAGTNLGNLQAGAYGQAQGAAQSSIQNQINALLGAGTGPSQQQQLLGGGLGAFSQFLLPLLMKNAGVTPNVGYGQYLTQNSMLPSNELQIAANYQPQYERRP